MTTASIVGEWLEPIITPESARYLLNVKTDPILTAQLETYAAKANEGQLTKAERNDYEAYLQANNLLAILQVKARRVLRDHPPA